MVGDKIPTFGIEMYADTVLVKYPMLPKTRRNISIDLKVDNANRDNERYESELEQVCDDY